MPLTAFRKSYSPSIYKSGKSCHIYQRIRLINKVQLSHFDNMPIDVTGWYYPESIMSASDRSKIGWHNTSKTKDSFLGEISGFKIKFI